MVSNNITVSYYGPTLSFLNYSFFVILCVAFYFAAYVILKKFYVGKFKVTSDIYLLLCVFSTLLSALIAFYIWTSLLCPGKCLLPAKYMISEPIKFVSDFHRPRLYERLIFEKYLLFALPLPIILFSFFWSYSELN